jgi:RNA polymerase sigma-70 factor, ECF subfamily
VGARDSRACHAPPCYLVSEAMAETTEATEFEALRPLLFSIAYRMLGSASAAEDVVQEAFIRFHRAAGEGAEIESPKAYLSAVTTRLAIDELRSARSRRESYVGEWLPEPLLTDAEPDAAEHAETADTLSLAFLVLLETLSPVERAVFLLHDVFDFDYAEIGRIVGKSAANCRQIALRARRRVDERRPRFEASRRQRAEVGDRFFTALVEGDLDTVLELLAPDVVLHGDGGGKAPAIPRPLFGRERVGRALLGWAQQGLAAGIAFRPEWVNGHPGGVTLDPVGRIVNVLTVEVADGLVQTVHSILNPDKLHHLGPVANARDLLGK